MAVLTVISMEKVMSKDLKMLKMASIIIHLDMEGTVNSKKGTRTASIVIKKYEF